jgi:hypothetical protein
VSYGSDILLQLLSPPPSPTGYQNDELTVKMPNFGDNTKEKLLLGPAQSSPKETEITKQMVRKLQTYLNGLQDTNQQTSSSAASRGSVDRGNYTVELTYVRENSIRVVDEGRLKQFCNEEDNDGGPKNAPRLDVMITSGERVLSFVEVGLTSATFVADTDNTAVNEQLDKLFWEKIDQSMIYLRLLRQSRVQKGNEFFVVKDGQTILMCVLVLDRGCTIGRMAVFACEPKGEEEFRIALMWRKEASLKHLDDAYGRFINGVQHLEGLDNRKQAQLSFEYLGPNCSKVVIDHVSSV